MKLYLSSIEIPNSDELLGLLSGKQSLSVAIIPDAWDTYPEERRLPIIEKLKGIFHSIGIKPSLIKLSETSGEGLRTELSKHSLVWVMGGNSFYLNYVVHKSGFAEMIKQLMDNGLVYGGESAGAVLATPTLRGVELMDDPSEAPEVIWEGLRLVDFGIIPHWDNEKYKEVLEKAKAKMEKHARVETLGDKQAFVINGNSVKVV